MPAAPARRIARARLRPLGRSQRPTCQPPRCGGAGTRYRRGLQPDADCDWGYQPLFIPALAGTDELHDDPGEVETRHESPTMLVPHVKNPQQDDAGAALPTSIIRQSGRSGRPGPPMTGSAPPTLAQAGYLTQRLFNGFSTPVRDRGRMSTRLTSQLTRAWAVLFTAPGRENYVDYADGDADLRRVRSELAAIRVRFPTHT
jgi:hypothetical protein